MNGEMYQICCITAAAKNALKAHSTVAYILAKYENAIKFQCLPAQKLSSKKQYQADSVSLWYEYCLKKGLQDIKVLFPSSVTDRNLLGFANTTQSSIVCFWEDGVTYFTAQWKYDSKNKAWNTLYTEHEWNNVPATKPCFENNREDYEKVLTEIKELAQKIGAEHFATVFQKALDILQGSAEYTTDASSQLPLPKIPEEHLCLFQAAGTADVFGAMGSWNDEPPYLAHQKGLDKAYDRLSDDLLTQNRRAILYAINES
jgi:hypothetical protein